MGTPFSSEIAKKVFDFSFKRDAACKQTLLRKVVSSPPCSKDGACPKVEDIRGNDQSFKGKLSLITIIEMRNVVRRYLRTVD